MAKHKLADKPAKPYEGFPLFPHATGRWAKKIRGRMCYFGKWEDADGALKKYQEQRDDLHAGRTPRVQADGLTVRDLLNHFLTDKRRLLDAGEIVNLTFLDHHSTAKRIGECFGLSRLVADLAADDFGRLRGDLAKTRGPVSLGAEIQRTRTIFRYGFDAGLIASPVRFGPSFKRPGKKVMRKERAARGPRMFEPDAIRKMIDAARPQLRAMFLLGVNVGFGNSDCGHLPIAALDLDGGWVTYPRPKTGVERRAALWPETVKALRAVLKKRPAPKDPAHADVVFVTRYGSIWAKPGRQNPVSRATTRLLQSLGLHRNGLSFYTLRHVFETIAGDSRDQIAVDHIMGHSRNDMASVYRERINDDRLKAVAAHVRQWLFPLISSKAKHRKKT